jgi:hypothetical protein
MNTAFADPVDRPTTMRRIDFRSGMDMWWEIVRNGVDTDGELLEVNGWLGPHSPSRQCTCTTLLKKVLRSSRAGLT